MKPEFRTAFTLIELLIVVAIIGILAAIALPNFFHAQIRAKIAKVQSEHELLAEALDSYFADHGAYPPSQATSADYYRGYIYLTTPIAYLHTYLSDPFSIKYMAVRERENKYDLRYEFMVTRLNGNVNNMFNMESTGPDGIDSFMPTPIYPDHPDNFEFYDPSNGLTSYGDILRAGGSYLPRWYRERKGGRATTGKGWI